MYAVLKAGGKGRQFFLSLFPFHPIIADKINAWSRAKILL
jgi:hypothetical protein